MLVDEQELNGCAEDLNLDYPCDMSMDASKIPVYGNFYDRPQTEKELAVLQMLYLYAPDKEISSAYFNELCSYTRSLMLQINKGKVFVQSEVIQYKTTTSIIKLLRSYEVISVKLGGYFRVRASFAGVLHWKAVEVLYSDKNVGLTFSYDEIAENVHNKYHQSLQKASGIAASPDSYCDVKEMVSDILDRFLEAEDLTDYQKIVGLLGVQMVMLAPRNRYAKPTFDKCIGQVDRHAILTTDRLLLELFNCQKDEAPEIDLGAACD